MESAGDTTETDEGLRARHPFPGSGSETVTDEELAKRTEREDRRQRCLTEKRQRRIASYTRYLQRKGLQPDTMVLRPGPKTPQAEYIRRRVARFTGKSLQYAVGEWYEDSKGKVVPYSPMHLLYDIERGYYRDPRPFYLHPRFGTSDLVMAYNWFIESPADKDGGMALGALLRYLQSGQISQWGEYLQTCQAGGIRPLHL